MRILVTGAAGLLGSRFIEWILNNHSNVAIIGVDDLSGGYRHNLPVESPKFKFYKMDAASDKLDYVFKENNITHVVHLAAYAAEGLSPFIRKFNYTNNLLTTANLINLAIKYKVQRFLFTSSMAVYGVQPPPFEESMIPNPIDPYGIAKFACEMDLRIAGEQHGLDWVVIRPHNVYGRNQNIWDPYRNVLGIWMWQLLCDEPITIYGDGLQKRAFSDMRDSCGPLWIALTEPQASKQIINLGGIQEYTILEAAHMLKDVVGSGNVVHMPARHEVKHAWSTWQKSVDLLGFEHKTDLYDGLTDMWQWAKNQPRQTRLVWSTYEITDGMYSFWDSSKMKR